MKPVMHPSALLRIKYPEVSGIHLPFMAPAPCRSLWEFIKTLDGTELRIKYHQNSFSMTLRVVIGLFLCSFALAFAQQDEEEEFIIAFGSCNKQYEENVLWEAILKNKPDVWIWGGDNIYSDTDDMEKMKQDYEQQRRQKGYAALVNSATVMGTWDDHDYGINDAGAEFSKKKESQQLLLDFFNVPENDTRRERDGVYNAQLFNTNAGSVKVIVLDTRYFRTGLTRAEGKKKRYQPNPYGTGTILGDVQWKWLKNELVTSKADFNIIVSSIQVLSDRHGFEAWGNFPHEADRLKKLIATSGARGVAIVSGDRHISEFSVTGIEGMLYPLVDFTSSGLTHAYTNYTSEPNPYRMGSVVSQISFGLISINFKEKKLVMQMRGKNNMVLQEYVQIYP